MAGKPKIKYIQLEPGAYPSDSDWVMMKPADRGIYHTLIIYILCNGGSLEFYPVKLAKLCNATKKQFDTFWQNYRRKFIAKSCKPVPEIYHKRATKELNRARKILQTQREAGLKGAKKRWGRYNDPNGVEIANENETKRSEIKNINTKRNTISGTLMPEKELDHPSSASVKKFKIDSLRFAEALEKIITPRSKNDVVAFRNMFEWLAVGFAEGKFDGDIHKRILKFAQEAKSGRKPIAVFFATLKRELGYEGKG